MVDLRHLNKCDLDGECVEVCPTDVVSLFVEPLEQHGERRPSPIVPQPIKPADRDVYAAGSVRRLAANSGLGLSGARRHGQLRGQSPGWLTGQTCPHERVIGPAGASGSV